MSLRPKILTIAGFDPSGGAGVLADIKTFESHNCLGFAVNTANTVQNEYEFIAPYWVDENIVFEQLDILLKKHGFKYVKIGLVPSLNFLKKVIEKLSIYNCQLIWDPILSSTSGFVFNQDLSELEQVLKKIYLITPNWNEVKQLSGEENALIGAQELASHTNVYLKGGHNVDDEGRDFLFYQGNRYSLSPKNKKSVYLKHGSGCVFSSALAANLAKHYPMLKACLRSKRYIEKYLSSSSELLGYHKI